jgi:hypothetical protein
MKERPILFSGDMVRAILEGRKTQTRRIIKPQPSGIKEGDYCNPYNNNYEHFTFWTKDNKMRNDVEGNIKGTCHFKCPYGQPGDRLWVRETWRNNSGDRFSATYYENTMSEDEIFLIRHVRKRPSILMPRWASRITLEIINIRVERLQDIDDKQAGEEGIEYFKYKGPYCDSGKLIFKQLWESINGIGSWDNNPWVWVIEFRKI